MHELVYNGNVVGVFSTVDAASEFARSKDYGCFSIFPLGTLMDTDLNYCLYSFIIQ